MSDKLVVIPDAAKPSRDPEPSDFALPVKVGQGTGFRLSPE